MLGRQQLALLPGQAFGVPSKHLAVRAAVVDYDGAAVLRAFRRARPIAQNATRGFVGRNFLHLAEGVRRLSTYLNQ